MNKLSKRALNKAITKLNKSLNHISNEYYEKYENEGFPVEIQKSDDELGLAHQRIIEARGWLSDIRDDEGG